ncbi:hypothetical protein E2I00_002135, partial [Balaenoptera physalus]
FLEDPERKYHFECCSEEQCQEWVTALRRARCLGLKILKAPGPTGAAFLKKQPSKPLLDALGPTGLVWHLSATCCCQGTGVPSQELCPAPWVRPSRPGRCLRLMQLSCPVQAECTTLGDAVKGVGPRWGRCEFSC